MSQDVYTLIQNKYSELQKKARLDCDEYIQRMYSLHPMLKQLTDSVSTAKSELIKATLKRRNQSEIDALEDELNRLTELKNDYIAKNNVDMSVFTPSYHCSACSDTGKLPDGTRCKCFNDYYAQYKYSSADMSILEKENFSTFNLEVFPETTPNGIPQRQQMEKIKNFLVKYCNEFPEIQKKNVLISGLTGTGKTFLLNCVARALCDKNVPVIRLSAYKMINELFDRYIDDNSDFNAELEKLCETDMLIIDDLGTELIKDNFTHNTLYYILDRRCELNKAVIISTNLNVKQLEEKYSDRIMSRLFNSRTTTAFQLQGADIRIRR